MSQIEMLIFFVNTLSCIWLHFLVAVYPATVTPQFPFVVSDLFLHIRNTLRAPFMMDSEELE